MKISRCTTARWCPSRGIVVFLGLFGIVLAPPVVQAVPLNGNLSITGSVSYDTGYAQSNLTGTGTQSGDMKVIQGGASTSSTFIDASITGSNPLNGNLTELGDGFDFSGNALADDAGSYGTGIDIGLTVANHSATDTYKITFTITFDNRVNSSGSDAYAHSNFSVFDRDAGQTLFFTDLMSDTLFGNKNGGVSNGIFGGVMTETGSASFAITLLAGQSVIFDPSLHDLSWTLNGSAGTGSASSATLSTFLSITSVETQNAAPEPAAMVLFGIGLAGLRALRRRRRPQPAN
ncbi:PEP-CTERM sorting domain-containing protein [Candidatus Thiodictyon syntrophicum]|jgi:hypothetical protein|uniref:Ice-binding protein C-terminal domain-containing protein n=1 Tax=Candidatus Thiodictyon syntrophicum TaxID=1166950 RepID=A0A2K8U1S2_9GAMM|nr:PEP-CTERM sorting domain-containing protein [Candidatus Thiodictyon syntrophicum]AUB79528.1 hypothetical protein THSYN_00170 [Candidatus Thiodictyon syntrophicum]